MKLLLRVAIAISLISLLVSALLSVLSSLLSITSDSFPGLADPDDHE
jgi:hypothetical protein